MLEKIQLTAAVILFTALVIAQYDTGKSERLALVGGSVIIVGGIVALVTTILRIWT